MKEYHSIIPAAYLILQKENKILLLKRINTGYEDGNYSMIAGHVDKGESFTASIIREAKEEAGIIVNEEDLHLVHMRHRKSRVHDSERIDAFFTATKWTGDIQNREPEKCEELKWFDVHNLPDNIIPHLKSVLEHINKKEFYSEYGWNT